MNSITRLFIVLIAIVLLSPLAAEAYGHHGHFRGGIWFSPWIAPYPYYSEPYYSYPPVVIQEPPTEYYVQPAPQQQEEQPSYWYYCKKPEGYYPYVKQCPEGWMKVVPNPPAQK